MSCSCPPPPAAAAAAQVGDSGHSETPTHPGTIRILAARFSPRTTLCVTTLSVSPSSVRLSGRVLPRDHHRGSVGLAC